MPISPRAPAIGLPTLRDSSRESSSWCSSTSVASRRSSRARSAGATARHARERRLRAGDGGVGLLDAGRLDLGDRLLGRRVEDRRHSAGRLDELLEEALVLAGLRVPEDADDERLVGILEPLDGAVVGPRDLAQAVADSADALVVMRLDGGCRTAPIRDEGSTRTGCSENSPTTSRCSSWPTISGRCWTMSPPRATFSTWKPRQIASTGRSRCERRLQQRELAAVALGVRAGRRRMRLGAVLLGLEVVAAGEDQPVERVERLLDPVVVRRHEQRSAARPLDRAHVVVRDERRLERASGPTTRARRTS